MGADDNLFPLGQVVATPGAIIALVRAHQEILELLARHQHGDWGAVDSADSGGNHAAVRDGSRILSVYRLLAAAGRRFAWAVLERHLAEVRGCRLCPRVVPPPVAWRPEVVPRMVLVGQAPGPREAARGR